jgi:hypothetical protein
MSVSPLSDYLAGVEPGAVPKVVALDRAIRRAYPEFDVAIKYRILMYTLAADWRTWVCAIEARQHVVSLRFLYGVILDDPRHVLRAGTSVLKTWDFGPEEKIDLDAVSSYVGEAVAKHADYKARAPEIFAASRSSHRKPNRS